MATRKGSILNKISLGFMHVAENSAKGLRSWGERCWVYVSIYENTPKTLHIFSLKVAANYLVFQGRLKLELALQALTYIEENNRTSRPIWNYSTGTLTS